MDKGAVPLIYDRALQGRMSSQGGPKLVSIIGLLHLLLRTGLFWQEEEEEEQIGDIERERKRFARFTCPAVQV